MNNRVRLFPTEEKLVFGVGLEGSLSPLPPFSAMGEIDFIYFDGNHLNLYDSPDGYRDSKLDDLSVAMRLIPCPVGQYIERRIGMNDIERLRETKDELAQWLGKFDERGRAVKIPLEVIAEGTQNVAYVQGPLFGDYSDSIITGDDLVLRFSYVPTHMLSLVMSHNDLFNLLAQTFDVQKRPGVSIVQKVDMQYHSPRKKPDLK